MPTASDCRRPAERTWLRTRKDTQQLVVADASGAAVPRSAGDTARHATLRPRAAFVGRWAVGAGAVRAGRPRTEHERALRAVGAPTAPRVLEDNIAGPLSIMSSTYERCQCVDAAGCSCALRTSHAAGQGGEVGAAGQRTEALLTGQVARAWPSALLTAPPGQRCGRDGRARTCQFAWRVRGSAAEARAPPASPRHHAGRASACANRPAVLICGH